MNIHEHLRAAGKAHNDSPERDCYREAVLVRSKDMQVVEWVGAQHSEQGETLNHIILSLYRMFGDRRIRTFNPDGGTIRCGPGIGMTAEQAEEIGLHSDLDHLVRHLERLEPAKRGFA